VKELNFLSPQVIVTRSSHPRAASPLALAAEFAKWGINPRVTEAVTQALSQTLAMVEERDLICVTGSLFVVAEALDYAAEFQISKSKSLGGGAKGFLRQHVG
jgi:dihydrofolate synthase/folylpolyglutamate synthase